MSDPLVFCLLCPLSRVCVCACVRVCVCACACVCVFVAHACVHLQPVLHCAVLRQVSLWLAFCRVPFLAACLPSPLALLCRVPVSLVCRPTALQAA